MRNILFLLLFVNLPFSGSTQDSLAIHYADLIRSKILKTHIKNLASNSMQGRHTGDPGQKKAAVYLYQEFKKHQLCAPSQSFDSLHYFQPFSMLAQREPEGSIQVDSKTFRNMDDFLYEGRISDGNDSLPIVFVGWGRQLDFENENLKDKAILFLADNQRAAIATADNIHKKTGAKVFLYANGKTLNQYSKMIQWQKRIYDLNKYYFPKKNDKESRKKDSLNNPKFFELLKNIPQTMNFAISPEIFQQIMGESAKKIRSKLVKSGAKEQSFQPIDKQLSLHIRANVKKVNSENVLALIPGKELTEETIVVSAHYDHLGKKGKSIFYGANDNASGTAALLELARVFQQATKEGNGPRRNILFLAFSGEEKGMLGSKYYVNHPTVPLQQTIVNLNIDMIGRKDDHHKNSDYIYLAGTNHLAPKLKTISDSLNQLYSNLELDYEYDYPNNMFYQASDQASFVKKGIPAIFYFNGLNDDYHSPSDTWDKIDFQSTTKVTRFIFHSLWELANRTERISKTEIAAK
ncbi:MAG: M28 family metallopeptidase [Marinifilaceae bacterium]